MASVARRERIKLEFLLTSEREKVWLNFPVVSSLSRHLLGKAEDFVVALVWTCLQDRTIHDLPKAVSRK